MAVLNVRYNISEEEALKLCSNVYTRTGSALKNNMDGSKIFKHLKEIGWDIEKDKAAKSVEVPAKNFSWLLSFVKTPVGIVIAIVLSVVTVGFFVWYLVSKKKKERQAELDQAYFNLNKAILKYVGAISEGTVSCKIIKSVVDSANKLMEMKNSKKYKVNFDDEQITTLLGICQKYTAELAKEKGVILEFPKTKKNIDSKVQTICWYMGQQAELLKKAG